MPVRSSLRLFALASVALIARTDGQPLSPEEQAIIDAYRQSQAVQARAAPKITTSEGNLDILAATGKHINVVSDNGSFPLDSIQGELDEIHASALSRQAVMSAVLSDSETRTADAVRSSAIYVTNSLHAASESMDWLSANLTSSLVESLDGVRAHVGTQLNLSAVRADRLLQSAQVQIELLEGNITMLQSRLVETEIGSCPTNCTLEGHGTCDLGYNATLGRWRTSCKCARGYNGTDCQNESGLISITPTHGSRTFTGGSRVVNTYCKITGSDSGARRIHVDSMRGISAEHVVLLIQMQGTNNGQYQFAKVVSISGNSFVVDRSLRIPYITGGISTAQVVVIPVYDRLVMSSNAQIRSMPWNGFRGGIAAVWARTISMSQTASFNVNGQGFAGAPANRARCHWCAYKGESYTKGGSNSNRWPAGAGNSANNGGGGGSGYCSCGEAAGVGSYGTVGQQPTQGACSGGTDRHGRAGSVYGDAELTKIYLGSAGSGGCADDCGCDGGCANPMNGRNGGGMIIINAVSLTMTQQSHFNVYGQDARDDTGRCDDTIGSAGSGGAIYIRSMNISMIPNANVMQFRGGRGNQHRISQNNLQMPNGGNGRWRMDFYNLDGRGSNYAPSNGGFHGSPADSLDYFA